MTSIQRAIAGQSSLDPASIQPRSGLDPARIRGGFRTSFPSSTRPDPASLRLRFSVISGSIRARATPASVLNCREDGRGANAGSARRARPGAARGRYDPCTAPPPVRACCLYGARRGTGSSSTSPRHVRAPPVELGYMGDIRYEEVLPVLQRLTAAQLRRLEDYNPVRQRPRPWRAAPGAGW